MEILFLVSLIIKFASIFALDNIIINPSVRLNYIFNSEEPVSTFEYKKWGGHHGLSEPNSIQANIMKNLSAFANRWLKPDAGYFSDIPNIAGTNLPDLSWFDNATNQQTVLSKFPVYLEQYGDIKNSLEPFDLIYCIEGDNWPQYMLKDNGKIPYNYSAGSSLITESLQVIYNITGLLPKYFEPQNEPWTSKFGNVTSKQKIDFQNYVNNKVYHQFKDIGNKIIVGGPAMDGIAWLKKSNAGTVWSLYFEPLIVGAKELNYSLDFISWHLFSSFANDSNNYVPQLYGSGAVAATMDLVESYTNSVNNYDGATKILISEHGYAAETDEASNKFNVSYMQYLAVNAYITDTMLFLERPDSQYKIDGFYLNGNYAVEHNYPVVLINDSNQVTATGNMYLFNKLLNDNGGNIIETNVIQGLEDRVKVQSFYNDKTNKLIIAIKEISWSSTSLNISIEGGISNNNVNSLRIYWDVNIGELIYKYITLNLNENIALNAGETLILYDIEYNNNKAVTNLCRNRYYSNNFNVKSMNYSISDSIKIDTEKINNFVKAKLRISLSWNTETSGNVNNYNKFLPNKVMFDNTELDISLKRIDTLVQYGMGWIVFEYDIANIESKNIHLVNITFADVVTDAFLTSIVAEVYSKC